jgi:hypothetical protein
MNTTINVDHQDGVVFAKVQADTGITYVAVDPTEVKQPDRGLLVRHGRPENGQCGYYPLYLILESDSFRRTKAKSLGKRPPTPEWVAKIRTTLAEAGVPCMQTHH